MKQIFGCLLLLSASSLAEGLPSALQVPGEGRMFNGWSVTPAGKAAALPGDMPLEMIVAPDGRVAVTVCAGYHNPGVGVLDLAANSTRKFYELDHTWNGLAFDKPGKRLFVSGGSSREIHVFSYADGELTAQPSVKPGASDDPCFLAGIAIHPDDGKLYVCN